MGLSYELKVCICVWGGGGFLRAMLKELCVEVGNHLVIYLNTSTIERED